MAGDKAGDKKYQHSLAVVAKERLLQKIGFPGLEVRRCRGQKWMLARQRTFETFGTAAGQPEVHQPALLRF
jgi:hypothetical protein